MPHDRVIQQALVDVQDLLWANLPPSRKLPDQLAIASLRKLLDRPEVKDALERGNDTVCAFALRGVFRVVAEDGPPRATLNRLWDILQQPDLGRALGKWKSLPKLWLKKPPAR
jgi:hypothetical protein